MGKSAVQVIADRAARDAARQSFDKHYGEIKADISERGISGRIADEAIEQAKEMFDEAVAVAEANPGVIGGTIAALALWLLRNPLTAWFDRTIGPVVAQIKEPDSDQD